MTPQSAKSKGRRLQNLVVETIRKTFGLSDRDVRSTPSGCTGADVLLSDKAVESFPYTVECKNTEKLNVWEALKQAHSRDTDLTPLLVFTRNKADVYCALLLTDFINVINKKEDAHG